MNVTKEYNNGLFGKLQYFKNHLENKVNKNRQNKMNKLFQPTFFNFIKLFFLFNILKNSNAELNLDLIDPCKLKENDIDNIMTHNNNKEMYQYIVSARQTKKNNKKIVTLNLKNDLNYIIDLLDYIIKNANLSFTGQCLGIRQKLLN